MLTAYFDESGTHAGSAVTVLAGFIAPDETWLAFGDAWAAVLSKAGVASFHATDCDRGTGEFTRFQRFERNAIRGELIDVICASGVHGVGSAVHRIAWETETTEEFRQRCPKPYILCFNYCVQHLFGWSHRHAGGQPFSLVFASQQEYQPLVAHTADQYRASQHWGAELATLTFAPARQLASLQAADLIAHETFKYMKSRIAATSGAYPDPPPDLAKMIAAGINFSGGSYDAAALRMLIATGPTLQ